MGICSHRGPAESHPKVNCTFLLTSLPNRMASLCPCWQGIYEFQLHLLHHQVKINNRKPQTSRCGQPNPSFCIFPFKLLSLDLEFSFAHGQ